MKRAFANIGFTFAVTLILLNLLSVEWALAAFIAASVLFVLSLCVKKLRQAAAFPISMLSAALACFIFVTYCNSVWMPQTVLYDKTANCSFYITDLEDKTENGYAYTVKTCRIDLNSAPQEVKLKLYTNTLIDAEPYQIIDGTVVFYSAGENGFESHGLFAKGIFASGYAADYRPTEEFKAGISSVNSKFIEMRRQLRENFSSYIGGDEGALTLAVLTGDTTGLSNKAYNDFKACGATHLMAVSGFNLAVFTGVLYKILRRLLCPRVPIVIICSLSVIFYVMLAGFSSSMIRAAIMMLVFLASKLFKERADSLNSLGFAAFLVCLDPFSVTDAGALLTFTAVIGLVVISPHLMPKKRIRFKPVRSAVEIIVQSVSVFITTFPVMQFIFGEVSIIGILLNVVLIPLSEILMLDSMLLAAVPDSSAGVFISKAAAGLMLDITAYFGKFSFSTAAVGSQYYSILIFCVFVIFACAFFIKALSGKRLFALSTAISCIFAVICCVLSVYDIKAYNHLRILRGEEQNAVIVYNDEYAAVFGLGEYEQYYTAKQIIDVNDLSCALIIDYDGEYAAQLASETECETFITNRDVSDYELKYAPLYIDDYEAELWHGAEIRYSSFIDEKSVTVDLNGNRFAFNADTLALSEKYDIIYSVNENGYKAKGVSEWAG